MGKFFWLTRKCITKRRWKVIQKRNLHKISHSLTISSVCLMYKGKLSFNIKTLCFRKKNSDVLHGEKRCLFIFGTIFRCSLPVIEAWCLLIWSFLTRLVNIQIWQELLSLKSTPRNVFLMLNEEFLMACKNHAVVACVWG